MHILTHQLLSDICLIIFFNWQKVFIATCFVVFFFRYLLTLSTSSLTSHLCVPCVSWILTSLSLHLFGLGFKRHRKSLQRTLLTNKVVKSAPPNTHKTNVNILPKLCQFKRHTRYVFACTQPEMQRAVRNSKNL